MTKAPFSLVPLLWPTVAFVSGVLCGNTQWGLIFATITCVSAITIALTQRYKTAALMALCAIGAANAYYRIPRQGNTNPPEGICRYQGDIIRARIGDTSQNLIITITGYASGIDSIRPITPFDASITIPSFNTEFEAWHTIVFTGNLSADTADHDLPDELSPSDILASQHIYVHGLIPMDSIKSITPTKGILASIKRWRVPISHLLLQSELKPASKEFLCTALIGDSSVLDANIREDFASAGLAHILALSGLHVGLIAMLVSIALWPVRIWGAKIPRVTAILILLWLYAIITGLSPSVVRATTMLSIFLGADMLQRRNCSYNSLCCAALVILAFDPEAIFTIGFQLSFAAVAAILLLSGDLNPISPRHRILYAFTGYLCVSLAAVLGTAMISCIYFHTFPLYFLLANIVTSLLLPWLVGAGVILLIIEWCGFDPGWLCTSIDFLYCLIAKTAGATASLPGSTINNIYIPAWTLIPYTCIIATIKLWITTRKIIFGTVTALLTLVTAIGITSAPSPSNTPAIYLTRTTYHTNLLAYDGDTTLYMITTAQRPDKEPNLYFATRRYADFMGKRSINHISDAGDALHTNMMDWNRPWLRYGHRFYAVISNDTLLTRTKKHVDYALICRGFRGNMTNVANVLHPDSIILSYDLHPKRTTRYKIECDSLGIPCRAMRYDGAWQLPSSNSSYPRKK